MNVYVLSTSPVCPSPGSGYWVYEKENNPGAVYFGTEWKNEPDPYCRMCMVGLESLSVSASILERYTFIDYVCGGYRHLHVASNKNNAVIKTDGYRFDNV